MLAGGLQRVRERVDHGAYLGGEVGVADLDAQVAAIGEADHAQILDQPRQPFDLREQAAIQRVARREHAFGEPLQPAAQHGHGRAQLVRDRRVPEGLLVGHTLQFARERVEVVGEQRRFLQRTVAGDRACAEIAARDAADAVRHRIQRHEDAARQVDRDDDRDQQAHQRGRNDPHPLGPARDPALRLEVLGRVLVQQVVEHVGRHDDQHRDAERDRAHRQRDLAAQAVESHSPLHSL